MYSVEFLPVWLYLNMHAILLQEPIGPLDDQLHRLELGRGAYKRGYRGRREERRGTLHVTLLWCVSVCAPLHVLTALHGSLLFFQDLDWRTFWTWFMDLFGFFPSYGFMLRLLLLCGSLR